MECRVHNQHEIWQKVRCGMVEGKIRVTPEINSPNVPKLHFPKVTFRVYLGLELCLSDGVNIHHCQENHTSCISGRLSFEE